MNYIAHALIADDFDLFMLGQLLGDFAINQDLVDRSEPLRQGVRAHRALDAFTDSHPGFIKGVKLLETGCYRYAPVVMDVYLDWVLVRHWETFVTSWSFDRFIQQLYRAIANGEGELPERMAKPAYRMRTMDWLSGFSETDALHRVFYFMAKRVRKPIWMENAATTIDQLDKELEPIAVEILSDPELIKFSKSRF